jgi:murein DD-endopeptidase MepM/ murein hydrolase activator NlpD
MAKIGSGYGVRVDPLKGGHSDHHGVDYPVPIGTPLYANTDMTIVKSGVGTGYGNMIIARDSEGNTYKYAHLDQLLVSQKPGENSVPAGTLLGYTGNSGERTTGPHLHTEAIDKYGREQDPSKINPSTGRPWTDAAGFEQGKGLNDSKAFPDKNRASRPSTQAGPAPAPIAGIPPKPDPNKDKNKNPTGPGTQTRPRPSKGDVGVLLNPMTQLHDGSN